MSGKTVSSHTLELFVRSLSSSATGIRIEAIIEQLDQLQTTDLIEDYTVTIWGERVSTDPVVSEIGEGAFIRHRVAEFKQWATDHEMELEGGFETRTTHSSITDETHEFITLPCLALAARRNGNLEWIVPSSRLNSIRTVQDRLVALTREVSDIKENGMWTNDGIKENKQQVNNRPV